MSTPPDSSNDSTRLDRGKLLKRGAGIALGTSLYSMGDPLTVLAARTSAKALKPDGDLEYFNWAQYINPKLLKGFSKEYGVKVNESNFTNMDNMLAKLRAGVKYDVAFPEAQTAALLVKANLLAPPTTRRSPTGRRSTPRSTTRGTTRARSTPSRTRSGRPASPGAPTRSRA